LRPHQLDRDDKNKKPQAAGPRTWSIFVARVGVIDDARKPKSAARGGPPHRCRSVALSEPWSGAPAREAVTALLPAWRMAGKPPGCPAAASRRRGAPCIAARSIWRKRHDGEPVPGLAGRVRGRHGRPHRRPGALPTEWGAAGDARDGRRTGLAGYAGQCGPSGTAGSEYNGCPGYADAAWYRFGVRSAATGELSMGEFRDRSASAASP